MSRRILLPVAVGVALLGAVPALADANGSTETTTVQRSCSAPADNHYSAPTSTDCRASDGSFDPGASYQATYWTNDVRCGGSNALTPANPTGVRVYGRADQATSSGGLGACSDGSGAAPAPVQGRAGVEGGTSQGYRVVVDGDKDNAAPAGDGNKAQGYVVVQGGAGAPSVGCGDAYGDGGRADSDSQQARDDQAACG